MVTKNEREIFDLFEDILDDADLLIRRVTEARKKFDKGDLSVSWRWLDDASSVPENIEDNIKSIQVNL